ncbi:MAG: hypothetical protein IT308_10205 [Anaerolineaceae bacterium]|nr:hypothetical protein [Anaerolineaceae bacterium]
MIRKDQFQSSSKENVWLWLTKIITGLSIVIFLAIHFIVNHLIAPEGLLSYADILAYYSYPIVPVMEAGFLVLVVSHSFLGIRSIILDLNPAAKVMRVINGLLIALGSAAILYGLWLLIVLVGRSTNL